MTSSFRICVNGASEAEANRLATELALLLQSRVSGVSIERVKTDPTSMDQGAVILATILAAPAVIELAKGAVLELSRGIADWLRKRRANVTISSDGGVTVENVNPDDVHRIVMDALSVQPPRDQDPIA